MDVHKNRQLPLMAMALCLALYSMAAGAEPEISDLLTRYYRDTGVNLYNGCLHILEHVYNPYIPKEHVMPYPDTGQETQEASRQLDIYFRYAQRRYSVNLSEAQPEHTYQAMRVWFSGEKKRKDVAVLDGDTFAGALEDTKAFERLPFDRYFQSDDKYFGIMDTGKMAGDPHVVISNGKISFPNVKATKSPLDGPRQDAILDLLTSEQYVLSRSTTDEGCLVIADKVSDRTNLTRVELLFDKDYRIKRATKHYDGYLFTEEIFDNYMTTPSGEAVPSQITSRRYVPAFIADPNGEETIKTMLSHERTTTVVYADYNMDIPDDIFTPRFPYGATIFDTTVSPPIEFTAGLVGTEGEKEFFARNLQYLEQVPLQEETHAEPPATQASVALEQVTVESVQGVGATSEAYGQRQDKSVLRRYTVFLGAVMPILLIVGLYLFLKRRSSREVRP